VFRDWSKGGKKRHTWGAAKDGAQLSWAKGTSPKGSKLKGGKKWSTTNLPGQPVIDKDLRRCTTGGKEKRPEREKSTNWKGTSTNLKKNGRGGGGKKLEEKKNAKQGLQTKGVFRLHKKKKKGEKLWATKEEGSCRTKKGFKGWNKKEKRSGY